MIAKHSALTAVEPVILPDPATRFARTAARLVALSTGHAMAEWLRFMADLSQAQHRAARTLGPADAPARPQAGHPPLAPDRYRRNGEWRKGLAVLLDAASLGVMPNAARHAAESLGERPSKSVEALADSFLDGRVEAADAGAALFMAAALQVHYTRLAASLPISHVHLLPQRGLCPCCGSTPVAGVITEAGLTKGLRYLHCSLCATAWNHARSVCITCGQSRTLALKQIDGEEGAVKAETCDDCGTYAKMLYQARDLAVDPVADDLATLGLDLVVCEAGWSRHAPNPWLLG
jgi:FdhE protein